MDLGYTGSMAKKIKNPINWYLGKAINVPAVGSTPAGQIFVVAITYDRKLYVQFPNYNQGIHTVRELDRIADQHGGWVDIADDNALRTKTYNPLGCDLASQLVSLVRHCRECGMTDEDIVKGLSDIVRGTLQEG